MPQPLGPYIAVANTMPRHPKIECLSDKAFRLVVESWCYCSEQMTDGRIDGKKWTRMGTAKARQELVEAGLVDPLPGGDVAMHDYLTWQWSRAEILDRKASKKRGAEETNHRRWHVDRGVIDPACGLCPASEEPPMDDSSDDRTTDRYSDRSTDRSTVATFTSTSTSGSPTAAHHQSDAHETGGGGPISDDWKRLRRRLEDEGLGRRGWSRARDVEASALLERHGADVLWREALAGQHPAVLGGALRRWQEIPDDAKHLRPVYRCDEHHMTHHGQCPACRADALAGPSMWDDEDEAVQA
jgi:hypothetical protein